MGRLGMKVRFSITNAKRCPFNMNIKTSHSEASLYYPNIRQNHAKFLAVILNFTVFIPP